MKFFYAILTVALVSLSSVATINAAPLPAKVQTELSAALKGVDPTDQAAVIKAVLAVAANFPSLAADITGAAVASLSTSLAKNPGAANSVIPALVSQVAKSYPAQAGAVVAAAISSLSPALKNDVAPKVVSQSVEAVPTTETKAAVINSALEAAAGDTALTASINSVAQQNGFTVNDQGQVSVQNVAQADDNSGATGPVQTQSVPPPASGSGGGSGVASGTQPSS